MDGDASHLNPGGFLFERGWSQRPENIEFPPHSYCATSPLLTKRPFNHSDFERGSPQGSAAAISTNFYPFERQATVPGWDMHIFFLIKWMSEKFLFSRKVEIVSYKIVIFVQICIDIWITTLQGAASDMCQYHLFTLLNCLKALQLSAAASYPQITLALLRLLQEIDRNGFVNCDLLPEQRTVTD